MTRKHTGQPRLILMFGGPGAGKGVQAARLSQAIAVPHIASGELLRDGVERRTALGLAAQAFMQRGDLLPDELVSAMVLDRLGATDAAGGAILDGFPRTLGQAERLDAWLTEHGEWVRRAIALDVPEAVLLERLAQRRRADDTPEVAEKRIEEAAEDLPALLARYQAQRIDGTGSVEAIAGRIRAALDQDA